MEDNTMPKKSPLSMQIDVSRFEKATEEEKRQQDVMSESTTFFKDGMRKLMKNPLAVASMIVLILIIVLLIALVVWALGITILYQMVPVLGISG